MTTALSALLILFFIAAGLAVLTLPLFICSFLATTKLLTYPIALALVIIGYMISLVCLLATITFPAPFTATQAIFPFFLSLLAAGIIMTASLIYEKVKYHQIFYQWKGD